MRNLLAYTVLALILIGTAFCAIQSKADEDKDLVFNISGMLLCKPPEMARGDSTDCVRLPQGCFLVIPAHPREGSHIHDTAS
jgi:hypothetical protein